MRHVTHMYASCHTYVRVMTSCHTYGCFMTTPGATALNATTLGTHMNDYVTHMDAS